MKLQNSQKYVQKRPIYLRRRYNGLARKHVIASFFLAAETLFLTAAFCDLTVAWINCQ